MGENIKNKNQLSWISLTVHFCSLLLCVKILFRDKNKILSLFQNKILKSHEENHDLIYFPTARSQSLIWKTSCSNHQKLVVTQYHKMYLYLYSYSKLSQICVYNMKNKTKQTPKKTFLSTTTKENPSLRKYILVVPCLITRKKAIYNLINCD